MPNGPYKFVRRVLPGKIVALLNKCVKAFKRRPAAIWDNSGIFSRTSPVSRNFGLDRGQAIDRYFIEKFIESNKKDIQGRVLEIADNNYTKKFGEDRVIKSDVLHIKNDNPDATVIADLSINESLPEGIYDCIILTQTLSFIFDVKSAIRNIHSMLKSRGVLLVTTAGISQISRYDMERWGDYWRFTELSLGRLLENEFDCDSVKVNTFGNVMTAISFLHGLCIEDLPEAVVNINDDDYPVVITARVVKK